MSAKHIIAIDQSTSSTKVFLLDQHGEIVSRFAKPHRQFYPQPGHVEHDAEEIWRNVQEGIASVSKDAQEIAGIAISNQRETTVFWDRQTGEALCPAVVWQDVRGEYICRELDQHAAAIKRLTGLALSAYFPAAKAAAKLRENPELQRLADQKRLCIGTIDSFLVFRLTQGQLFATDVSNASRTQLMDLRTLAWGTDLCELFGVPMACLPTILPSDAVFGHAKLEGKGSVPILGVMGDSHASFFGQGCHQPGMVKATFGTGSSVMMHIGEKPLLSGYGLSTSVGYSFSGSTCYVFEGNVTASGDTLRWLIDQAGMASDLQEIEAVSQDTEDAGGVYLVPAFSGLGAPYDEPQARAIICGLSRGSERRHIIRAALESLAYQDADIIAAMEADTQRQVSELRVDGGPSANAVLMQFLADVTGRAVQLSSCSELSAVGAGLMAGYVLGLIDQAEVSRRGERYLPLKGRSWRENKIQGWKAAVMRSKQ